MQDTHPAPAALRETRLQGDIPIHSNSDWLERFPWLVQGTTGRGGASADAYDFRLFGSTPSGTVIDRWLALRKQLGFARTAHARQVHKAHVLLHGDCAPGLLISEGFDGHVTSKPGLLLAVTIADCVPVFVVDAKTRAIALLHSGWRGTAARILEQGLQTLTREFSTDVRDVHVHCGPAICGKCYEVSPEVHRALGLSEPKAPKPVDLRAVIADHARALGVAASHISISKMCTRCDNNLFFSHRVADPERQVAVLGIRADSWNMTNPGLCGSCTHARIVETKRGSRFYLCGLSYVDAAFPRYPPLPVVRCTGYDPRRGDTPVTQETQE